MPPRSFPVGRMPVLLIGPPRVIDDRHLWCPPGWRSLVDDAATAISRLGVTPTDIRGKEKFGRLTITTIGVDLPAGRQRDRVDSIRAMIENASIARCEECGAAARQMYLGRWIKTLCHVHALEWRYSRIPMPTDPILREVEQVVTCYLPDASIDVDRHGRLVVSVLSWSGQALITSSGPIHTVIESVTAWAAHQLGLEPVVLVTQTQQQRTATGDFIAAFRSFGGDLHQAATTVRWSPAEVSDILDRAMSTRDADEIASAASTLRRADSRDLRSPIPNGR